MSAAVERLRGAEETTVGAFGHRGGGLSHARTPGGRVALTLDFREELDERYTVDLADLADELLTVADDSLQHVDAADVHASWDRDAFVDRRAELARLVDVGCWAATGRRLGRRVGPAIDAWTGARCLERPATGIRPYATSSTGA